MTMRPLISTLSLSFLLTSCMGVDTSDPKDSFKYWAGQMPPDSLQVINGQYWQSGHLTKEYILHLKLKPTEEWWNEYVKQNNLKRVRDNWTKPSDFPDWFRPSSASRVYSQGKRNGFNDSRYFRDSATGICYIYEIQL